MARRSTKTPPPDDFEERILDIDVVDEMQGSYLEYAYSVIYSRALPDARDGLKPVHRRILYQMHEMGLRPERSYVKCARVVGEVMGKLHPHGDSAIYDALVRLAQSFSMRLPLVDGHGNFGSLGNDDPPAAMRYTECRSAPAAGLMVDSIDEDTVDFSPNYDGSEQEPATLPAAYPNLLVNGASGIAVGMATNMAPHNLGEVIAAARHLIRHPGADLETLMRYVPGPDLPTGGKIVGLDGIRDAYARGRGSFKIRSTVSVEQVTARRKGLVVSELPFAVGPEKVISKIKDLVNAKKLQGIADVKDLTDREHGLRLVIEIKNGFNPEAVLAQLYKLTPMEESFGINNVALVDGQPLTLGLKELLEVYVDHRFDVVRRRSEFRRTKRRNRLHLVEGLLVALLDIDEVIRLIRASENAAAAKESLMSRFELSEVQTQYILDTPLRRLTRFDRLELESERDRLTGEIEELTRILESDAELRKLVSSELAAVSKKFGTPRRTELVEASGEPAATVVPLQVADDPCRVLLSSTGLLARTAGADQPVVPSEARRAKHDVIVSAVPATARGEIGAVTSAGRLLRLPVVDLPQLPQKPGAAGLAGGAQISEFLSLEDGELLLCLTTLDESSPGLALGTEQGVVKRVVPDYPGHKDELEVITLKDGDRLVGAVELRTGEEDLVFVSSEAQLLRYPAGQVRAQGRAAGGMAGIKLAEGARVISFTAVDPAADAVVLTVAGSHGTLDDSVRTAKLTPFDQFPRKGRATGGVRCQRFLKGEDCLTFAWAGPTPARAATRTGAAVELPETDPRRDGSGVPLAKPVAAAAGPA